MTKEEVEKKLGSFFFLSPSPSFFLSVERDRPPTRDRGEGEVESDLPSTRFQACLTLSLSHFLMLVTEQGRGSTCFAGAKKAAELRF